MVTNFYVRWSFVLYVALSGLWLGEWAEVKAPGTAMSGMPSAPELLAVGILVILSWILTRMFAEKRPD